MGYEGLRGQKEGGETGLIDAVSLFKRMEGLWIPNSTQLCFPLLDILVQVTLDNLDLQQLESIFFHLSLGVKFIKILLCYGMALMALFSLTCFVWHFRNSCCTLIHSSSSFRAFLTAERWA